MDNPIEDENGNTLIAGEITLKNGRGLPFKIEFLHRRTNSEYDCPEFETKKIKSVNFKFTETFLEKRTQENGINTTLKGTLTKVENGKSAVYAKSLFTEMLSDKIANKSAVVCLESVAK